jgi:Golgi phosphoprotein 3 (GPP34)
VEGDLPPAITVTEGRLADEYWLIAHSHQTGRSRVAGRMAGLGLAAALIGELILSGHLVVWRDGLYPPGQMPPGPPGDVLLQKILGMVYDPAQPRDLGMWLAFLATSAAQDVRERMAANGMIIRVAGRRFARGPLFLPADLSKAAWPAIRLAGQLSGGTGMTPAGMTLTGLIRLTGLMKDVLWLRPDHVPGWERAEHITAELAAVPGYGPCLASLLRHLESAVGRVALT